MPRKGSGAVRRKQEIKAPEAKSSWTGGGIGSSRNVLELLTALGKS